MFKIITISGVKYQAFFPNVGQMLDIENSKMALSSGQYGALVATQTKTSNFILDLIDAVSTFSVLIPDLAKDLNYKSYLEVPGQMAKELVRAYNEEFSPWYEPLLKDLLQTEKKENAEQKTND